MPSSIPKARFSARDITVFATLSAMMFLSWVGLQWAPNVHPLALFIAAATLTYRGRALLPLYGYVLLAGVYSGFSMWWVPYLYIWLPLWGAFMLLGRFQLAVTVKAPFYMIVCGLHGLSFGVLYAPMQMILFGLSFRAVLAWIVAGLPFDIIHAAGNFAAGSLVVPLALLLKRLESGQFHG